MNNFETISTSLPFFVCVIVIILIIGCGILIIKDLKKDLNDARDFCLNKDGIFNVSNYDMKFNSFSEILNCSNKLNPTELKVAKII